MDTDFYLHISSDNSLDYFPKNNAFDFRLHLKQPLSFHGYWMCSLTDFQCEIPQTKGINLWVFSNLCDEMVVGDVNLPLLRRIPLTGVVGNMENHTSNPRNYLHIAHRDISSISLYIYGDAMEKIPLVTKPVRCTLHFKIIRAPWLQ